MLQKEGGRINILLYLVCLKGLWPRLQRLCYCFIICVCVCLCVCLCPVFIICWVSACRGWSNLFRSFWNTDKRPASTSAPGSYETLKIRPSQLRLQHCCRHTPVHLNNSIHTVPSIRNSVWVNIWFSKVSKLETNTVYLKRPLNNNRHLWFKLRKEMLE